MSELKCPSCKKDYLDNNPPRILTTCGHTFCQLCLKSMIKRKDYRFQIRCPLDKLKMGLDSSTPLQFPRNMVLIETMSKNRRKSEHCEDNQFLPNNSQTTIEQLCRSSTSFRSSAFLSKKRNSGDEEMCLLHHKPLDIICLQEKIMICAECALFGLHKGHQFSTIKDLQTKRNNWISQISQIAQKKKELDEKSRDKEMKIYIKQQIQSKRQSKILEIQQFYDRVRTLVNKNEQKLKEEIEKQMTTIQTQLTETINIKTDTQKRYKLWQSNILEIIIKLQSTDLIKCVDVFGDFICKKEDNIILKGNQIIRELEQQTQNVKNNVKKSLEFNNICFANNVEEKIQNLASVNLSQCNSQEVECLPLCESVVKPAYHLQSITTDFNQSQHQQISLLDFKEDQVIMPINTKSQLQIDLHKSMIVSTTSIANQKTERSQTSNMQSNNSSIAAKMFKKDKKKVQELTVNKSLINLYDNKMRMQSPKLNKKYVDTCLRKGSLNMAVSSNNKDSKLKRSIFKVKDPQRFDRLLKIVENDSVQTIDFTGLQLGNEITKQLLLKLKECKKIKNVRLMKNLLTDQLIPIILTLKNIQILNLAQNSFTIKVIQNLLQHYKECNQQKKQRSIQLGHNSINQRKCKDKIEELKKYGVNVSL